MFAEANGARLRRILWQTSHIYTRYVLRFIMNSRLEKSFYILLKKCENILKNAERCDIMMSSILRRRFFP